MSFDARMMASQLVGRHGKQAASGKTIEDADNEMNALARLVVRQAQTQWRELDAHIAWCDARISAHVKANDDVKKATRLMGIGPIGASASVATVGDFRQFKNGAQFGAWMGLVPRQHSSGGKNNLGGHQADQRPLPLITKRGDTYLRSLLIQGAKSAVMSAHKRSDPISVWVTALKERLGWQKAAVALASKNARILWAVMTKGDAFDAKRVSVKPGAASSNTGALAAA
jgi:transposase